MQISKQVVYGVAAAFLVMFAIVFFLLGRESARSRRPVMVATEAPPMLGAAEAPAMPGAPPPPMASAAPSPPLPTAPPPMPGAQDTVAERAPMQWAPTSAPAAPGPSADGAAAVRDYFTRTQAIQTIGPTGDTGEFANTLLTASVGGDTSGFDEMVKVMGEGAARARAIAPPPCCVEYHARLLAMLGESADMMRRLKAAIGKGDASELGALAASGSSLQSRASALEDEARSIKARYGIR